MAKFIEGEGWLVEEDSHRPPATGAAVVASAKNATPLQALVKDASTEDLTAVLSARGMTVLSVDDHDALLVLKEEHQKLQTAHTALVESMDGKVSTTTTKTKPAKRSIEEMEQLITAATTLDQLTELLKDEERKTVLKLGDARAAEIQEGKA